MSEHESTRHFLTTLPAVGQTIRVEGEHWHDGNIPDVLESLSTPLRFFRLLLIGPPVEARKISYLRWSHFRS